MRRWNEEAWRRGEGRARARRLQPAAALAGTAAAAAARGPWGLGPAPRRSKVCARSAGVAVGTCNASLRPRGGAGAVRPALRCAPRHEPWPSPHPSVSRSVSRSSEPSKAGVRAGRGGPGQIEPSPAAWQPQSLRRAGAWRAAQRVPGARPMGGAVRAGQLRARNAKAGSGPAGGSRGECGGEMGNNASEQLQEVIVKESWEECSGHARRAF